MQAIFLTTTGTLTPVIIDGVIYNHPVTNLEITKPNGYLDFFEVSNSEQLQDAINNGYITLTDELSNPITNTSTIPQIPTATETVAGAIAIASQPETDAGTVTNKAIVPATLLAAATVVHRVANETIDGIKTFLQNIFIDNSTPSDALEIGYFDNLAPEDPNTYGVRRTGASGYFAFMPNAQFPQLVLGSPTGTNQAFIDVTNNGALFLNQLDTGAGTPGGVTVGQGGLTVGSTNATVPNLTLTSVSGGTDWKIFVGSPGNFDDWLRFQWDGSTDNNQAVLLPTGEWRTLSGVAGSPGHGFINFSNYGMFVEETLLYLGLSTGGTPRFRAWPSGLLDVGTTANYEALVINDRDIPNKKYTDDAIAAAIPDRQFNQSVTQFTNNFAAGVTAYVIIPNTDFTTANTIADDYEITANFSCRVTNNNNRTLEFTLFVGGVADVDFTRVIRFDQANDDKSITIRYNLNLAASSTGDLRVRNINASANLQVNMRNVTAEAF